MVNLANSHSMTTKPDNVTIEELKRSVELSLGFEITSTRDCEVLAMELERFDRRFSLSVSTLINLVKPVPRLDIKLKKI